ncbi:MAG: hypothetical protein WA009_10545 [Phototrophicaceae bacterium]
MTDRTDALDRLFVNADAIIDSLGDEFTSQQFLRRVIHEQQHAYIDLLVAWSRDRNPFDKAHQHIGKALASIMEKRGFSKDRRRDEDINIFGNPTYLTTYRKND